MNKVSNKGSTLFKGSRERSWALIKRRLFEGSIVVYFVRGENCWGLLGVNPTLANLENDHGFISKGTHLHGYEAFWEAQNKAMRAYVQSGQYYGESRFLTVPSPRPSTNPVNDEIQRWIATQKKKKKKNRRLIAWYLVVALLHMGPPFFSYFCYSTFTRERYYDLSDTCVEYIIKYSWWVPLNYTMPFSFCFV